MGADLGCQLGLQQGAECVETQADRAMVAPDCRRQDEDGQPKTDGQFLWRFPGFSRWT